MAYPHTCYVCITYSPTSKDCTLAYKVRKLWSRSHLNHPISWERKILVQNQEIISEHEVCKKTPPMLQNPSLWCCYHQSLRMVLDGSCEKLGEYERYEVSQGDKQRSNSLKDLKGATISWG